MSRFLTRITLALLLGGSFMRGATAAEVAPAFSPGEPLTLRQAIVSALRRNPDLGAFAFALRAQDARIDAAGLKPAPVVSADLENVLGTGSASGLDAVEATFSLSQVIELGDKRSRRIDLARSGRDVIDMTRAAAQLDVIAEVGRRFIAVAHAQRQVEWTGQAVALARTTVVAAQRRVDAARSPEVELTRARVELVRAQLAQSEAAQTLEAARLTLAAMWGEREATFGAVTADLATLPRPAPFEALITRLEASPDFTLFATEARQRDAAVRLAESQRRADVQWSAGVRRLQESRDQAFVVGFSMPLFASRQAAPAVAEARALRGQVDAEREAAFVRARAQLQELYQALQFAIEEATVLGRDVLPAMEQAVKDTEYAYERGRYGYVELTEAQRAWLDAVRARFDAAARAQELQNEIERLAGEPIAREQMENTQP